MIRSVASDRTNNTGSADPYSDEFMRTALAALGHKLGAKGRLRLADGTAFTGTELSLLAMQATTAPALPPGITRLALSWLADDLAAKLPAADIKGATLEVSELALGGNCGYGLPIPFVFGTTLPAATIDVTITAWAPAPTATASAPAAKISKADALAKVRANAEAYYALPAENKGDPEVAIAAFEALAEDSLAEALARALPSSLKSHGDVMLALLKRAPTQIGVVDPTLAETTAFARRVYAEKLPIRPQWFGAALTNETVVKLAIDTFAPNLARFSAAREALIALYTEPDSAKQSATLAKLQSDAAFCALAVALAGDDAPWGDGLTACNQGELWLNLAEMTNSPEKLVADLTALSESARADLQKRMGAAGIRRLERFPTLDALERTLKEQQTDDGRPVLMMVSPRSDWNGYFDDSVERARANFPGYRVVYREWDEFFPDVVDAFAKQAGKPAELVIIGGHSTPLSTEGGVSDMTHAVLDQLTPAQRATLIAGVAKGANVILDECSAGRGGRNAPNMANFWSNLLAQAMIFAATVPSYYQVRSVPGEVLKLEFFDPDGQSQRLDPGYVIPPRDGSPQLTVHGS